MIDRRLVIFGGVCAACVLALAGYLYHAATRTSGMPAIASSAPAALPSPAAPHAEPSSQAPVVENPPPAEAALRPSVPSSLPDPSPQLIFYRHNGVDSHYGLLASTTSSDVSKASFVDSLQCEVVHVSGGRGICLTADRGVFTTYAARLFDARTFEVSATIPLQGIPSRCRVSIDGKLAALTVFVTGHGYTSLDFSTQTLLLDARTGAVLADIEDFSVTRDGKAIDSKDFNFWGVTFTPDAKDFYATLSTAGKHYLVRGNVATKTAAVIHDNVECPSLSPNARRVAYKKRLTEGARVLWQLHVLDLNSDKESPLSERRSVDDQLEWLDDDHVLYSVPSEEGSQASTDVWMAPADASEAPSIFLRNAYSPAAARGMPVTAKGP